MNVRNTVYFKNGVTNINSFKTLLEKSFISDASIFIEENSSKNYSNSFLFLFETLLINNCLYLFNILFLLL